MGTVATGSRPGSDMPGTVPAIGHGFRLSLASRVFMARHRTGRIAVPDRAALPDRGPADLPGLGHQDHDRPVPRPQTLLSGTFPAAEAASSGVRSTARPRPG